MSSWAFYPQVQEIRPLVEEFLQHDDYELEVRLGSQTAERFESGVDEATFVRWQSALVTNKKWTACTSCESSVDYFYPDSVRQSCYRDDSKNVTVRKVVVRTVTYTCPERRWDLRFRLSREERVPTPRNQMCESARVKVRSSYATPTAQYDLTYTQSGPTKMAATQNTDSKRFEIELELARPPVARVYGHDAEELAGDFVAMAIQLMGTQDRYGREVPLTLHRHDRDRTSFERPPLPQQPQQPQPRLSSSSSSSRGSGGGGALLTV